MEFTITEYQEDFDKKNYSSFVLGADVGGTNTTVAIAGIKEKTVELIFSLFVKSSEIDSLIPVITETLKQAAEKYNLEIFKGCIGVAGVVSKNKRYAELTNIPLKVDANEIIEKTDLQSVYIINDFEALGYGINILQLDKPEDVFIIRDQDQEISRKTKAVMGAGTGLGKGILIFDEKKRFFYPTASEGGHCDFPTYNDFERELTEYVKTTRDSKYPIIYEDFLSGRGLETIYKFLRTKNMYPETEYTKEIDAANEKTPMISKYREQDETCRETFKIFTKFYGRSAKNFVLDSLATGGLFIAGGIAAKNKEIFKDPVFFEEFENVYQYSDVLKNVPVFVITNEDIGLLGACFAATYKTGGVLIYE